MSNHVSVEIDGRMYRMACNPGEEEKLVGLAERFNKYVVDLHSAFGEVGDQRIAVMAAIMVTDELCENEILLKNAQAEIQQLQADNRRLIDALTTIDNKVAERLGRTAKVINNISDKLTNQRENVTTSMKPHTQQQAVAES